jgi:hypothetical protein
VELSRLRLAKLINNATEDRNAARRDSARSTQILQLFLKEALLKPKLAKQISNVTEVRNVVRRVFAKLILTPQP